MRPAIAGFCCAFALVAAAAGQARAGAWSDGFDYPDGSAGEPDWRAPSVAWQVEDGRMGFLGRDKEFLVLERLGHGREVRVEATLTLTGRNTGGWAIAGVAVRRDRRNHWHLALIESPKEQNSYRAVELAQLHEGTWLANFEGGTRLTRTADEGGEFRWQYGRPYRLRIAMTPQGIEGSVRDLDGTLRRRIAFRFDEGAPAVKAGQAALDAGGFIGHFDDLRAEVGLPEPLPEPERRPTPPPYTVAGCTRVFGRRTGFFHPEEHGGTRWLIDPNGRGFFAVGVDHANYHAHWCQDLGYAPHHRFVAEKYGSEERWAATVAERLRQWGFNTLAAGHSHHLRYTHFAHTEWLGAGRSFADVENIVPRTTWTGFPNVFSPRWPRHCDLVARQVCTPNRDDPWLLGYFLDNELQWFGDLSNWREEFGLVLETWKKPPEHTAKQAWLGVVRGHCPTVAEFNAAWGTGFGSFEDLAASTEPRRPDGDAARAMAPDYVRPVAERYFGECARAIRRHDPNHMVLGCRFAGWAPGVWDICGEHCDVVSLNSYERIDLERGVPRPVVERYRGIQEQAGRPLMITEWSFPALDSGLPCQHGAGMRVATQEQKARCYELYQRTLFSLPFMVGSDYFMYVDQPALGISDTFPEDSNYGLVTERDEPWPELTETATRVNARACELHAAGSPETVYEPKPRPWDRPVPPPTSESPRLADRIGNGPLRLRRARGGRAWTMRHDGEMLGAFFPVLHQRTERDHWTRPNASRVTAVREGPEFLVVDMTFSYGADPGGEPPPCRAGWRFWVPGQASGWFGSQSLWVESAAARPWRLAGLFHYTSPALGGSEEGDGESELSVPNFYIPLAAWVDRAAGLGQGVIAMSDELKVSYWKDSDGFHSDCRQQVDVRLEPGERHEAAGPLAVIFGYETTEEGALLRRADEVRSEAAALADAPNPND